MTRVDGEGVPCIVQSIDHGFIGWLDQGRKNYNKVYRPPAKNVRSGEIRIDLSAALSMPSYVPNLKWSEYSEISLFNGDYIIVETEDLPMNTRDSAKWFGIVERWAIAQYNKQLRGG